MTDTRSVVLLTSGNVGWTDIRNALAGIPGVKVVADVASVRELVDVAAREQPAAIIMPARIGDTSLLTLLPRLQPQPDQRCQIVLLAHQFTPSEVAQAISQGAAALLMWSDLDLGDLLGRLQNVILGGDLILTASVVATVRHNLSIRPTNMIDHPNLTERELLILQDLSKGLARREIAQRHRVSPRTVTRAIERLMVQLSVANPKELLVKAAKNDLV